MPELPDVEQFRRFFRRHATGRTVASVWADPAILRNAGRRSMSAALRGRRFAAPDRHGKWLLCWTDGPAVLLHFGMTGELVWSGTDPLRHRWDRFVLMFEGGDELRYRDMRKFGGAWLAHDRMEALAILGPLGPDALAVSEREFVSLLDHRRGAVKAALMDQRFVAGVGNLLADEILWQARLHPTRPIGTLDQSTKRRLYRRMHGALQAAVDSHDYVQANRRWLSHVRGEPDARCPRCRTPLSRTVAAGRTTYFCPACQPAVAWGP